MSKVMIAMEVNRRMMRPHLASHVLSWEAHSQASKQKPLCSL